MLVVRNKRKSLEDDRLQRQQASSKVQLFILSPESRKVRQDSVRRERMIQGTSVTVNEKQNSELADKLMRTWEVIFGSKQHVLY